MDENSNRLLFYIDTQLVMVSEKWRRFFCLSSHSSILLQEYTRLSDHYDEKNVIDCRADAVPFLGWSSSLFKHFF